MLYRSRYFAPVLAFVFALTGAAQDRKKAETPVTGSVTGVVTAKGETWIEVKSDDQARARRYTARWKDAGDAAKIKAAALNARVKLNFTVVDYRPRVDKIEVLAGGSTEKKPEPKKTDPEKKPEPKKAEPEKKPEPKKAEPEKKPEPKKTDPEKKPEPKKTVPPPRVKE